MSRKPFAAPLAADPRNLKALSQLCNEAAGHVARARVALFVDQVDADAALSHLDDAIACLRRLVAHSRPARPHGSHQTLRTAS
jgi:hypothetical protein